MFRESWGFRVYHIRLNCFYLKIYRMHISINFENIADTISQALEKIDWL